MASSTRFCQYNWFANTSLSLSTQVNCHKLGYVIVRVKGVVLHSYFALPIVDLWHALLWCLQAARGRGNIASTEATLLHLETVVDRLRVQSYKTELFQNIIDWEPVYICDWSAVALMPGGVLAPMLCGVLKVDIWIRVSSLFCFPSLQSV